MTTPSILPCKLVASGSEPFRVGLVQAPLENPHMRTYSEDTGKVGWQFYVKLTKTVQITVQYVFATVKS